MIGRDEVDVSSIVDLVSFVPDAWLIARGDAPFDHMKHPLVEQGIHQLVLIAG